MDPAGRDRVCYRRSARGRADHDLHRHELDARLKTELGVPGGLTSEQVATRASATSYDVRARRAEVLEAAAEVDRAAAGYLPRLTANARDARQSRVLAQRSAFEDSLRIEVVEARESEVEAAAAVKASAEQRLAAEEAYRVRRALFQVGRATSVELSDAENDLTRARLEALRHASTSAWQGHGCSTPSGGASWGAAPA